MKKRPSEIKQHLKRLIMLRLLIVTIFLCFGVIAQEVELSLLYMIVTVLILSILYAFWLASGKRIFALASVQLGIDFVLQGILIHLTGGLHSVFTPLMAFTIFSSALVLEPQYGFLSSLLAGSIFFAVVLDQYWSPLIGSVDWLYVGYISYVHISILLLVGFLASSFARRISNMEAQIHLNERLSYLGEMVAQLAHEIRNPLMSITGSIELLKRHTHGQMSQKDEKLMDTVVRESERLTRLLAQVLNYAREENYAFAPCSIKQILDEVFLMLENNATNDGRVCVVKDYQQHYKKRALTEVDPDRMKQVFINLIINGFQAMPDGGMLQVDAHRENGTVSVSFRDTGCGIPHDQLEKIFIPFSSSRPGGTGIGLAVAQKIVRQHGGKITVESKEGVGSTFTVSLPAT